tara:strand:- start:43191 stop:44015 length:825 start_codon:yes stop_codon:yes gene_type:complete
MGSREDLNAPADSTLAQDFDAVVVRPTDFHYEVAQGRRQGATTWNKWGYNSSVAIGTEYIWAPGGDFTSMDVANTLTVASTSIYDSAASNGATGIVIYGVNASRKSVIEVVTLNGTSNVETTNSYLGVNRMALFACGGSKFNAGTITAKANVSLNLQASIPAGEGSTQQLIFFTQSGHQAMVDWLHINVLKTGPSTSPVVTIKMWVYSAISAATYEVARFSLDTAVENNIDIKPSQPLIVGANSIVYLTCTTDKVDTVVSARMSLIEFRDSSTE